MTHPFERLTSEQLVRCFYFLLAATLVLAVVLGFIGGPLGTVKTAKGNACDIVSFEFAGTVDQAQAIINAWNAYGIVDRAKWNTWLDYLFLLSYPNLIALGIVGLLARPMTDGWRTVGRLLAWAQWVVLVSDATENFALLRILYGTIVAPWPQVAYVCAAVKFGFLFEGIVFLLAVFLWRLYLRLAHK